MVSMTYSLSLGFYVLIDCLILTQRSSPSSITWITLTLTLPSASPALQSVRPESVVSPDLFVAPCRS